MYNKNKPFIIVYIVHIFFYFKSSNYDIMKNIGAIYVFLLSLAFCYVPAKKVFSQDIKKDSRLESEFYIAQSTCFMQEPELNTVLANNNLDKIKINPLTNSVLGMEYRFFQHYGVDLEWRISYYTQSTDMLLHSFSVRPIYKFLLSDDFDIAVSPFYAYKTVGASLLLGDKNQISAESLASADAREINLLNHSNVIGIGVTAYFETLIDLRLKFGYEIALDSNPWTSPNHQLTGFPSDSFEQMYISICIPVSR